VPDTPHDGLPIATPALRQGCVNEVRARHRKQRTCERQGKTLHGLSAFNASDNLQFHYRNQHVNPEFLQGGYLGDFDLSGTVVKMGSVVLAAAAKCEHWNFPLLSATPKLM
jgi:hypothetical protein